MAAAFCGWFTAVSPAIAQSWTSASTPWNCWISVASSADGSKLLVAATNGPIYISTDSGASWALASTPAMNWSRVAESADGTHMAAAAWNGTIYISTNSGAMWLPSDAPSNYWTALASSADGTKLLATAASYDSFHNPTTPGVVYLSSNSGVAWTLAKTPNEPWIAAAMSADGNRLIIANFFGTDSYVSTDSGGTWNPIGPGGIGMSLASSADGSKLIAVERVFFVWLSTNGGLDWIYNNQLDSLSRASVSVASSADGNSLVVVAGNGQIITSTNTGSTWQVTNVFGLKWSSVASSADGSRLVAVSLDGGVFTYGTETTNPAPTLGMAQSGGNLVLWWPYPSTGFLLQQNPDLTTTNWTDVTTAPTVVNQVILSPPGSNIFYRLKTP